MYHPPLLLHAQANEIKRRRETATLLVAFRLTAQKTTAQPTHGATASGTPSQWGLALAPHLETVRDRGVRTALQSVASFLTPPQTAMPSRERLLTLPRERQVLARYLLHLNLNGDRVVRRMCGETRPTLEAPACHLHEGAPSYRTRVQCSSGTTPPRSSQSLERRQ